MSAPFTTRPELRGDIGMVASTHWLASASGMAILERGGNAADAAVATGFVLQVVEPHLNGPGGEVPILLWSPAESTARVICGQGVSPAAATPAALEDLDIMPGTGLLPAVVPGAFGAWLLLLERYGTRSLREVMEPAIHYAERGYPLPEGAAEAIATVAPFLREHWPTSAALWCHTSPVAGERRRNPLLADTLRHLVEESEAGGGNRSAQIERARRAWYEGFVAEAIDRHSTVPAMDSSGRRHPGLLTGEDLVRWRATIEDPVALDYDRFTVLKPGPWSQGPVMLQQLALLDHLGIRDLRPGTADWIHLIVEASKLAFADREAWYGDPLTAEVPLDDLLSGSYSEERSRLVGETASYDLVPGAPGGRTPHIPAFTHVAGEPAAGIGEPTIADNGETRGDTCHLDVVDRDGMMISATPSGGWMQSSPAIPGLGFCLSTRGQMFTLEQGHPNSLRPGARPRTTLSASIALRDGRPWMAFGTPGGDAQDQWSLQMLLNVVHGGMNLQEAIDAPEFHSSHMPSSFFPRDAHPGELTVEGRMSGRTIDELGRRGHRVVIGGPWSQGRLSAVAIEDGWLKAAANPRRNQGYAVGR